METAIINFNDFLQRKIEKLTIYSSYETKSTYDKIDNQRNTLDNLKEILIIQSLINSENSSIIYENFKFLSELLSESSLKTREKWEIIILIIKKNYLVCLNNLEDSHNDYDLFHQYYISKYPNISHNNIKIITLILKHLGFNDTLILDIEIYLNNKINKKNIRNSKIDSNSFIDDQKIVLTKKMNYLN